jgi:hypothetical protein
MLLVSVYMDKVNQGETLGYHHTYQKPPRNQGTTGKTCVLAVGLFPILEERLFNRGQGQADQAIDCRQR